MALLLIIFVFIVMPFLELYLLWWSWGHIGFPETVGLIVLTGIVGASLARYQGLATLQRFQASTARGEMPHKEMMDGLLILVAGAVLLTPGFITDTLGFLLLVPPVRALIRRGVGAYVAARVQVVDIRGGGMGGAGGAGTAGRGPRGAAPGEGVINAEFTVERAEPEGTDRKLDAGADASRDGS